MGVQVPPPTPLSGKLPRFLELIPSVEPSAPLGCTGQRPVATIRHGSRDKPHLGRRDRQPRPPARVGHHHPSPGAGMRMSHRRPFGSMWRGGSCPATPARSAPPTVSRMGWRGRLRHRGATELSPGCQRQPHPQPPAMATCMPPVRPERSRWVPWAVWDPHTPLIREAPVKLESPDGVIAGFSWSPYPWDLRSSAALGYGSPIPAAR